MIIIIVQCCHIVPLWVSWFEQFKSVTFISTEGALIRPMTYDNHPIHSSQSRPHMASKTTAHELRWTKMNLDKRRCTKMHWDAIRLSQVFWSSKGGLRNEKLKKTHDKVIPIGGPLHMSLKTETERQTVKKTERATPWPMMALKTAVLLICMHCCKTLGWAKI